MAKLFEYVIVHNPRTTVDAQGNDTTKPSKLLVDVTRVLADNDKEVGIRAAREIPEEYLSKLDEVEITVRPF